MDMLRKQRKTETLDNGLAKKVDKVGDDTQRLS